MKRIGGGIRCAAVHSVSLQSCPLSNNQLKKGNSLFMKKLSIGLIVSSLILGLSLSSSKTSLYDWLQFNGDPQHSGNNTMETLISSDNVMQLQRVYQVSLPGVADGAPAYLSSVSTPDGVKNLIFVTTKDGTIAAIDTQTGGVVWSHQNPAGTCHINNGGSICYTTSSPAIDPNRQFVYSYGLDGYVHKYQVGDGMEITGGGWPELTTLKAFDEKGSPPLTIATTQNGKSYLYAANGGYPGDRGDYQGHITAIDLSSGTQTVFNAACSDQTVHFVEQPGSPDCPAVQSAIWARAAVVYDPALDKIFMVTGNGDFDPASHYWGDTVFALHPDGTGANGDPLDSFTPTDFQHLQDADLDLGSTAPALLPVPVTSTVQHLGLQTGKDAKLRLLNLENLSGQGGPGHTGGEVGAVIPVPQGGQVLTAPAVWVDPASGATWVFVANSQGISGLKLVVANDGTPGLSPEWQDGSGGTSPVLANGVLFYATPGRIRALNPLDGHELWSDTQIGGIHWESPIVANGALYITDENAHLTVYALGGTLATATATLTPTPTVPGAPTITPTPTHTPTATPPTASPTLTTTPGVTPDPGSFRLYLPQVSSLKR
jgi:outer membrane protein assembly factor BamB